MVDFPADWMQLVGEEFTKPYFLSLIAELKQRKAAGEIIYPPGVDIFRAFRLTPVQKVRVVLLGQDPYHGPGQAHGLSFSVPLGVKLPPSLQNIYKEIAAEFGSESIPKTGDLTNRAQQGVLLLNAILTVQVNAAASHHGLGREQFTDAVIHQISVHQEHVVFLLRGNFAKSKQSLIDTTKHLVLTAAHPSPLSAHNGFFGCGHFAATNNYLRQHQYPEIQRLPT